MTKNPKDTMTSSSKPLPVPIEQNQKENQEFENIERKLYNKEFDIIKKTNGDLLQQYSTSQHSSILTSVVQNSQCLSASTLHSSKVDFLQSQQTKLLEKSRPPKSSNGTNNRSATLNISTINNGTENH